MQKNNRKPTRSRFTLLRQLCNLIPNHLVPGLARQHDAQAKSRTFKPWGHVVSLLYAQLTHALGLNDVCDALRLNAAMGAAKRAVVLGAGLVGMHAAENLVKAGVAVTIVEMAPHLTSGYFDPTAAALIEQAFTDHGAKIMTGSVAGRNTRRRSSKTSSGSASSPT